MASRVDAGEVATATRPIVSSGVIADVPISLSAVSHSPILSKRNPPVAFDFPLTSFEDDGAESWLPTLYASTLYRKATITVERRTTMPRIRSLSSAREVASGDYQLTRTQSLPLEIRAHRDRRQPYLAGTMAPCHLLVVPSKVSQAISELSQGYPEVLDISFGPCIIDPVLTSSPD